MHIFEEKNMFEEEEKNGKKESNLNLISFNTEHERLDAQLYSLFHILAFTICCALNIFNYVQFFLFSQQGVQYSTWQGMISMYLYLPILQLCICICVQEIVQ